MPDDGSRSVRSVDVRELVSPPVDSLVAALGELEPGECIEIRTRTVPIELCDALEEREWRYEAVRNGGGGWRMRIAAETGADRHDVEARHHRATDGYDR